MKDEESGYIIEGEDPVQTRVDNKESTILEEARKRFDIGMNAWSDTYDAGKLDHEFLAGNQWPEDLMAERQLDGRPCLTINKLPQFVAQIVNEMKMNPTSIKVAPVEGDMTEGGGKNVAGQNNSDYEWTDIIAGLIRNIEYNSDAVSHYNRAADNCTTCSVGWLRVYTKYAKWDSFDLDVVIKSVANPWSVVIDPSFTETDASDMNWGFCIERVPKLEFERRWPEATKGDFSCGDSFDEDWDDEETVMVAEYFSREPQSVRLFLMSDGQVFDSSHMEAQAKADGVKFNKNDYEVGSQIAGLDVIRIKDVVRHKVVWRKITAWSILEGGTEGRLWPGDTIPLVPMFGRVIQLSDRRVYQSAIRDALDPQREYNYWRSAATEAVALAPSAPWIGTHENFEQNQEEWQNSNRKNYAYLGFTPDSTGITPQRNALSQTPAAEMSQSMNANDDIKATMGIYDASLGQRSNETSGRAIIARQKESDVSNYHFAASRDAAVARVGRILVDIIPKVYDAERTIRIRTPDEREDFIKINEVTNIGNEQITINDITRGKYDVEVYSGPSYSSIREEVVDNLVSVIEAVPQIGVYAMDILAENMNWPGADQLARRLKKAVPQEVLDEEDIEDREPVPPTPQQQLEAKIAEDERRKEEAKATQKGFDAQIAESGAREAAAQASVTEEQMRETVAKLFAEIMVQQRSAADSAMVDKTIQSPINVANEPAGNVTTGSNKE